MGRVEALEISRGHQGNKARVQIAGGAKVIDLVPIANPFDDIGGDDDFISNDTSFNVKVISFEERKTEVKVQERIWQNQGRGKVVSYFDRAADFKRDNLSDFRRMSEQAAVTARLNAAACAPGDGHGTSSMNSSTGIIGESLMSSPTNIFSKTAGQHESGKHRHCEHGEDFGKCKQGCKAA